MNKLVRDNIPALIEAKGKKVVKRKLSSRELEGHLVKKLEEEVSELMREVSNKPTDIMALMYELADVVEVVYAITRTQRAIEFGLFREHFLDVVNSKRQMNGSFEEAFFIEKVE